MASALTATIIIPHQSDQNQESDNLALLVGETSGDNAGLSIFDFLDNDTYSDTVSA